MQKLDERNLFLISLDEQDEWYRYHYLSAQVLRARLKQRYPPQQIRELHARASDWFETHLLIGEAVRHALDAEDWNRATRLMEMYAEEYWRRGEMTTLERWLAEIPADVLHNNPRLLLVQAMTLVLTAPIDFRHIDELLTQARALLNSNDPSASELRGRLLAAASANAGNQADTARTIALAQRALHELAPASFFWRVLTQVNLGIAYVSQGEPNHASDSLEIGIQLAHQSGMLYLGLFGQTHVGNVRLVQGRPRDAEKIFLNALGAVEAHRLKGSPVASYLQGGYGKLLYEWNDLAQCRAMLEQARAGIDARARVWVLKWKSIWRAWRWRKGMQTGRNLARPASANWYRKRSSNRSA